MTFQDLQKLDLPKEVYSLIQRGLASAGDYKGTYLGKPGPKTKLAFDKFMGRASGKASIRDQVVERMLEWAQEEVGTVEAGGNNKGGRIRFYQSATWLEGSGWPWCAAFICAMVRHAIVIFEDEDIPFNRPQTAGAFDFERWAREQPGATLHKTGKIKRGDIVVYDFSHIGVATADEYRGKVTTIEGNTGPDGGRDGDGVWDKSRSKTLIRSWIRLDF